MFLCRAANPVDAPVRVCLCVCVRLCASVYVAYCRVKNSLDAWAAAESSTVPPPTPKKHPGETKEERRARRAARKAAKAAKAARTQVAAASADPSGASPSACLLPN